MSGCQNGVGIGAGRTLFARSGTSTPASVTVTEHQKDGIVVDRIGSDATITGQHRAGCGRHTAHRRERRAGQPGRIGDVSGNTITGHQCDHTSCGPDPLTQTADDGVLLFDAGGEHGGAAPTCWPTTTSASTTTHDRDHVTVNDNTVFGNRYVGLFIDQGNANVATQLHQRREHRRGR